MATSSADTLFSTLPIYLQRRIDSAFNKFIFINEENPKSLSPTYADSTGGGFLSEDVNDSALSNGGEYLLEDSSLAHEPPKIPMDHIPSALQSLDLPPDDEQVLAVFRNAASGWESSTSAANGNEKLNFGMISRDDWRSVCAVLFETHREKSKEDGSFLDEKLSHESTSDDYQASETTANSSDEDCTEGDAQSKFTRRTRSRLPKSPSISSRKLLTRRQQEMAIDAFSLFFPSIPCTDLVGQKITLNDIQRTAKIIGEQIKAEEMIEMLELFSTDPEKSIGLTDFGHIMVASKLA